MPLWHSYTRLVSFALFGTLGAIPMALATLFRGFLTFVTPHLPAAIGLIALPLWRMDASLLGQS